LLIKSRLYRQTDKRTDTTKYIPAAALRPVTDKYIVFLSTAYKCLTSTHAEIGSILKRPTCLMTSLFLLQVTETIRPRYVDIATQRSIMPPSITRASFWRSDDVYSRVSGHLWPDDGRSAGHLARESGRVLKVSPTDQINRMTLT